MTRLDKFVIAVFVLVAIAIGGQMHVPFGFDDSIGRRPVPPEMKQPPAPNPTPSERVRRPPLPPPSVRDPELAVDDNGATRNKIGTAFAVDAAGAWFTARHVVNGCARVYLDSSWGRLQVRVTLEHPVADFAVLQAGRDGAASALISATPELGEDGFVFGYPSGKLGAAQGQLLGRSRMSTQGGFSGVTPTLTWADIRRVPDLDSLSGMSGGPMIDEGGDVVGVLVAESQRRGRMFTVAPELLREAMGRLPARRSTATPFKEVATDRGALERNAQSANQTSRIARVICFAS